MGKRKRIATILTSYTSATGVTIYLINLIRHFKALDDHKRPELFLFHNNDSPVEDVKMVDYPYIKYINSDKQPSLIFRIANKATRVLLGRGINNYVKADYVYPALETPKFSLIKTKIFWKEDFQECYLPENFTPEDINYTKSFFKLLDSHPEYHLVLSSESARNDLIKFYGQIPNPVHILRFVSLIPELDESKTEKVKEKFGINTNYFIVCNQFWPHKNHITVIEAVAKMVREGYNNFKVVLTGKTTSHRNKEYFPQLEKAMHQHGIRDFFIITGFLEREDQLILMKHSMAVVQPSLFEGWSTVIEDAKALNKYVIASDLEVNKEQLNENVAFFKRKDAEELSGLMINVLEVAPQVTVKNYQQNIDKFRHELAELFQL